MNKTAQITDMVMTLESKIGHEVSVDKILTSIESDDLKPRKLTAEEREELIESIIDNLVELLHPSEVK